MSTSHTVMLRPQSYYAATIGYGFAYYAWMRLAPFKSYRLECAEGGSRSTFFKAFEALSDELVSEGK